LLKPSDPYLHPDPFETPSSIPKHHWWWFWRIKMGVMQLFCWFINKYSSKNLTIIKKRPTFNDDD
jgi:hypothetical protein